MREIIPFSEYWPLAKIGNSILDQIEKQPESTQEIAARYNKVGVIVRVLYELKNELK